jgi:hypothetical protein
MWSRHVQDRGPMTEQRFPNFHYRGHRPNIPDTRTSPRVCTG